MEEVVQTEKKGKGRFKKVLNISAYAAGDALGGGVNQVISLYYMNFLMFVMGLSPILAGLVTAIGKVWDGVTDPAMGLIVDRTKSKLGSCRPWMLVSVIPLFVSYFLMWYGFGIEGQIARFFYFTFAYMLFSTAFTVGVVPYEALLPRMVDGYQERTNYSSVRMIFSGVAAVASTYIYEMIIPVSETNQLSQTPEFVHSFMILGLVLGVVFALPMLITFLGTKEKIKIVPNEQLSFRKVFTKYSELLKNKLYRKCYFLTMLGAFNSYAVVSSTVIFVLLVFGNKGINISLGTLVFTLTLTFIVVNLKGAFEIGFFVPNVIMMKKYNKHRPLVIDLPLLFAGCFILLFINASSPLWLYLIGVALIGAGTSCLSFVPNTLLPDLPDVDELIYGQRREGISAGLVTLGRKVVQGVTLFLFGVILSAFGLNTDTASPELATASSLTAIKIMLCVIPIVGSTIMFLISRTYNLDKDRHQLIKERIAQRHEKGSVDIPVPERIIFEEITGLPFHKLWIATSEERDDFVKADEGQAPATVESVG